MLWLIDYSPVGIAGILKVSSGVNILDFETRHTADFAYPWLNSTGQAGRIFHLTRVMPLGILFPPSFMLFMFCWLSLLLQKTTKSNSKFCLIALLPPVYMLLDWTENIEITAMLMNFPERLNKICVATGIITSVKKVVLLVIISYIILLAALLIKRNGGKNNAKTER
ncbi:MAG: hypothetical protein MR877_03305 [Spirochaetia bacterium]|nr:hypothetical protein [Spirochaetia bacterium]